jgi:hypothetical protein
MIGNTLKYGFIGWLIIATGIYGCAALGPVVTGASYGISAVSTATKLLSQLDTVYDRLVEKKPVPATIEKATVALSMADDAAKELEQVASGQPVTDASLNTLAGQVAGAMAIYNQIKK